MAAILLLCLATPGKAATFLIFNGSTGVFGNDLVSSPSFDDTIDLGPLAPGAYLITATISSSYQEGEQAEQDIDFTSVMFNGIDFTVDATGRNEFRFLNSVASGNTNLFQIRGTSGTNSSYSGTINVAAIPEPSSWAMMMIGFFTIGAAIRRRPLGHAPLPQAV
ncbi:MAG: FxDxF family PEP-CTERM protein [Rhizorhabdus sp.]